MQHVRIKGLGAPRCCVGGEHRSICLSSGAGAHFNIRYCDATIPSTRLDTFAGTDLAFLLCLRDVRNRFTYLIDKHVRVDVIRQRLTPIWRERTERTLLIVLLIPLALTILWFGSRMAWISFVQDEGSRAALGLSSRWIIKARCRPGRCFSYSPLAFVLRELDRRRGE